MGPNETSKLLHSKGNHKQNKKTTHRMGENICKRSDQQGINLQNIQIAHAAQYQKKNQKQTKKNQSTQSRSGQKVEIDISPKKTYRCPKST